MSLIDEKLNLMMITFSHLHLIGYFFQNVVWVEIQVSTVPINKKYFSLNETIH